jgi:hypothetical protein
MTGPGVVGRDYLGGKADSDRGIIAGIQFTALASIVSSSKSCTTGAHVKRPRSLEAVYIDDRACATTATGEPTAVVQDDVLGGTAGISFAALRVGCGCGSVDKRGDRGPPVRAAARMRSFGIVLDEVLTFSSFTGSAVS